MPNLKINKNKNDPKWKLTSWALILAKTKFWKLKKESNPW